MSCRDATSTSLAYVLTAAIGALLCWWGTSSIAVAVAPAVALFLVIESLSRNLPTAIRSAQAANCRRRDGSWSMQRERAEAKAVGKLRGELLFAVTIVILPANALLWFVHTEVIPLSIGIDAFSKFNTPRRVWRDKLESEERKLDRWGREKGITKAEMQSRKRMLWEFWPVAILAGLGWMAAVFAIVKAAYLKGLQDLSDSMTGRLT